MLYIFFSKPAFAYGTPIGQQYYWIKSVHNVYLFKIWDCWRLLFWKMKEGFYISTAVPDVNMT